MNSRFDQLDSIRGLAAVTVMLSHIGNVSATYLFSVLITGSPLKVLINGSSAVLLFFILSGFVLSLPLVNGREMNYPVFVIRRILRIYVPYLVSIIIAILLSLLLSRGGINELSYWFNLTWTTKFSASLLFEHFLLIGNVHSDAFNNVIWSLVHEMRISLLFPLVYLVVIKFNWKFSIIIGFFLSLFSILNDTLGFQVSNGYYTSYWDTLHYTSMFIFGGVIAKHLKDILGMYHKLTRTYKWLLLIAAFIFYNYPGIGIRILNFIDFFYPARVLMDYIACLGAVLFIIIALGSHKITKILMIKPINFIGKISYSLYLYHLIVLLSLFYLLYNFVPIGIISTLTILVSIFISTIAYYFVEVPSMKLGKTISYKQKVQKITTELNQSVSKV
ncbi:acyltransferase family protein [Lederbergia panacisoli]|uniref:acyltransferase family protein n=1 Tax=Lederbergia panacisoli TaxID=1255251 RepID=UPI00214C8089|nr:acyltransferase [Lederbergia panacisoli]MCR2822008.1 acyltransferase [Lederbergia panacisoli]